MGILNSRILEVKRKKQTTIIIFILLGLFFLVWHIQPKTPLATLEKEYMGREESVLQYTGLIEQIDINLEGSLLFYFNGNGNVNCAVVEKGIAGYKIIDVNAELASYHENLKVGLYGSTYDEGNKWIYFGVIYDESVEKVVWNDVGAIKFTSSNMDMLYAIGDGQFEGDEYYLYDSNGSELESHIVTQ